MMFFIGASEVIGMTEWATLLCIVKAGLAVIIYATYFECLYYPL